MPASVISPSAATIASLGSAPVLKADEREQLELVREHFSDPTFALPEHGKAGQPLTALLPGERYWLVRSSFIYRSPTELQADLAFPSSRTVERMLSSVGLPAVCQRPFAATPRWLTADSRRSTSPPPAIFSRARATLGRLYLEFRPPSSGDERSGSMRLQPTRSSLRSAAVTSATSARL